METPPAERSFVFLGPPRGGGGGNPRPRPPPRPRPVAGAKFARRAPDSGGERNERRSRTRFDAHRRHDDNPTRGHSGGARERDGAAARRLRSWPVAVAEQLGSLGEGV